LINSIKIDVNINAPILSVKQRSAAMSNGLEDVIAAETVLSDVDGLAGRLVIRGLPLAAIAGRMGYEDVLGLLWDGFFPDLRGDLARPLGEARVAAYAAAERHFAMVAGMPAFDAVRLLMAGLPDDTSLDTALRVAAAPGVFLAAVLRLEAGQAPIPPDAGSTHAADVLRMISGKSEPARAAALDAYLVTVIDHGLNASTFAARVVASTQAGLASSVLAALGALKGPLHGGAPGPVLDMIDAIGTAANAGPWIEAELGAGRRLMGFGHRIYRVRDPRADALNAAIGRLRKAGTVDAGRLELAAEIEAVALAALKRHKPDRQLLTNVEFYTALLLEAAGFPRESFTAVFATGRVGGWIAHAVEQAGTGRLIRPRSHYVGPEPKQAA
jgi:citrate synthase